MVKERAGQEFPSTRTIMLVQQSCWVLLFTLDIIILVQLWVAGEGPTIEWPYLARKIVRERDDPCEVM